MKIKVDHDLKELAKKLQKETPEQRKKRLSEAKEVRRKLRNKRKAN